MASSSTASPAISALPTTISLPSFASGFEMAHASPRSQHSTHSSRSNSREPRPRHFRPYPESNTRSAPRDERPRKRPAPVDEDPEGDVGMSDREQDGDDESSGSSPPPVKQEQMSDVEQSPSPPPTPAGSAARPVRYMPPPQTQFAPTPPASARRVSPPHITLPTLPQHASHVTLPPLHLPPPEPQPYSPHQYTHAEPMLARKRRRVTISGVAANSQGLAPPRPLHRTVLERAGSGFNPPPSATPATPTALSGMVSPVVTPGFNMSSPGAINQVRDTIAIRMEQKALIEQRKNGGSVTVTTPHARVAGGAPPPALPRTQSSPAGQTSNLPTAPSTSPSNHVAPPPSAPLVTTTASTPTTLTAPPTQTQTLAHRRGKASSKLTIHTPNTSISSQAGSIGNTALGLTDGLGARLGLGTEVAIRSAPPGVTRFDPATLRPPPPPQPAPQQPLRSAVPPQAAPLKERSVSIRRMHASSTAGQTAPPAPLAIVAPGQPLTLNAPAPPSSYIATPTRTQFPPSSSQTPHHPTHHHHHGHMTPRTTTHPHRPPAPASPPISRSAFMAFYDAYAEVHSLRAQLDRMEREMERRVEMAVREMRDEIRMLRDEIRRSHDRDHPHPREREAHPRDRDAHPPRERDPRDWEYPRERPVAPLPSARAGSASVTQSPMQVDKRPLPTVPEKMQLDKPAESPFTHKPSESPFGRLQGEKSAESPFAHKPSESPFAGRLPGPGDRLPPPPGERVPGPGERIPGPGERILGPGERVLGGERLSGPSERLSGPSERHSGPSERHSGPSERMSGPGASERHSVSDKLHPHPPRSAMRKSPSGRVPSSLSPPSRPPSVGATGEAGARTRAKARVRTRSPSGNGNKSGSA